ncbi:MAG: twin-arginine translocase TatA/TatE family subunit [Elusimicrobia bacterium]|nr:twin-arginine translocase TatA/TatE family subunit [Elusimicrobiota bacterium]
MLPNVGFTEILLIGGIALLLFGPKRIPEAARGLGRAFRTFKEGLRETTDEIKKTDDEAEK